MLVNLLADPSFRWPTEVKPVVTSSELRLQLCDSYRVAMTMAKLLEDTSSQSAAKSQGKYQLSDRETAAWPAPSMQAWDMITATAMRAVLLLIWIRGPEVGDMYSDVDEQRRFALFNLCALVQQSLLQILDRLLRGNT